ncbi:MAG: ribonuclease P protein component [Planctomycetota bacterium]|jgi:ribonuclease P protein component
MTVTERIRRGLGGARPNRFTKALRIRKGKEYDRVFQEGKKVSDGAVMVVFAPNGIPHSRFGILAGKKLGNAVKRNRVKRIFREAFRLSRIELPVGYDFVVVPRRMQHPWTLEGARASLKRLAGKVERS